MRVPPLCCCCCCAAVLSLEGVLGGMDSEQQAEKHQGHSSILQQDRLHAEYSSVAKITAKL